AAQRQPPPPTSRQHAPPATIQPYRDRGFTSLLLSWESAAASGQRPARASPAGWVAGGRFRGSVAAVGLAATRSGARGQRAPLRVAAKRDVPAREAAAAPPAAWRCAIAGYSPSPRRPP